MRLFSIIVALIVSVALYALVFERDRLFEFAGRSAPPTDQTGDPAAAPAPQTLAGAALATGERRVSVVALRSEAEVIGSAVLLRGQTEALREVEMRAETSGRIVSEPLRKGTVVAAGDTLCRIDPGTRPETLAEAEARLAEKRAGLPVADARLAEAEARRAEAAINRDAAAGLIDQGYASRTRLLSGEAALSSAEAGLEAARSGLETAMAEMRAAEASVANARREIARLTITAPFDGVLETDTAELGALMQPGAPCATVIQLDPIKVVGFVPETEVHKVATGSLAGARLISGREITGAVTFLGRSADPLTRTFRVEITVPNADFSILDGQTADIAITSDGVMAHRLPASALTLDNAGRLGVRVAQADPVHGDVAVFVPVELQRDTPDGVLVTGPDPVARVIVVGQEYVTDGVPVLVTLRDPEATQ